MGALNVGGLAVKAEVEPGIASVCVHVSKQGLDSGKVSRWRKSDDPRPCNKIAQQLARVARIDGLKSIYCTQDIHVTLQDIRRQTLEIRVFYPEAECVQQEVGAAEVFGIGPAHEHHCPHAVLKQTV